ncbi:MAG: pucL [Chloroflexi bacterium]|nr:pucL [Chloroflexota bacterium]
MDSEFKYQISYGKTLVPVYRVYATPLSGITPIRESAFKGKSNNLVAFEVDVEVLGNNFLPAYIEGDNSQVVATDSMKNFIIRQGLAYTGSTLEGYLDFLGQQFLTTYSQMEGLRLTGRELPFVPVQAPAGAAGSFEESPVLYSRSHDDYTVVTMDYSRQGDRAVLSGHRCGRINMELLKVTGSSFTSFVRDGYTTLPERGDRPLFIHLSIFWQYADTADLLRPDHSSYVAGEQVRDLAQVVFHEFVSESIQHLVHEIGQRLLERFPQVAEVSFEAKNQTPDPIATSLTDSKIKVYSAPFPAFGLIKLTVNRNKL